MKKSFPGYQPRMPSKLWATCTFSFDASALLDLYRMTPKSRAELLSILDKLKPRVWLPHQAALEYLENRLEVIRAGVELRARISKWTRNATEHFKKEFDKYQQYQWVDAERWVSLLTRACEEIDRELEKDTWDLEGFENSDPIEARLSEIFSDERLGKPYSDMLEIFSRAEQRIQLSIPPGFKDAAQKKDYRRYGDVVLWFQLLDFAKSSKKPIVFVTSDSKGDWWQRQNERTLGPRPELIQEMHVVSGMAFHLYTPAAFIEYAAKYLELQAEAVKIKAAAKELREIESTRSAYIQSALKGLYPQDVLAADLLKTANIPWPESQRYLDFLRAEGALAQLPNANALLTKALNDVFVTPTVRLNEALQQLVTAPITGMKDTAAQFARAMQNMRRPFAALGVSDGAAGQEERKASGRPREQAVSGPKTDPAQAAGPADQASEPKQGEPDRAPADPKGDIPKT